MRAQALARACGALAVTTLFLGSALGVADAWYGDGTVETPLLATLQGVIFALLVTQLVATAVARPGRWIRTLALVGGLMLWALGGAVLAAAGQPAAVAFPAPGEWLFLAAYAGFATYLVMDGGTGGLTLSAGLDAAIVCGGAACLAGFTEVAPVADSFGRRGLPLIIALVYPMLDTSLILTVLTQVVLRSRRLDSRTLQILAALALLALADTSLVTRLSTGAYDFGVVLDTMWGLAFVTLVGAACREVPTPRLMPTAAGAGPDARPGSASRWDGVAVLTAGGIALVALTFQPENAVRPYVVIPAVITLLVAGTRMTVALRQARGAAEAFRLSLTDHLTGLPNRRALDSWLAQGLGHPGPLGLLLLDLNGFKEINDTLGHAAGDTMLCLVAERISAVLGSGTQVARLSGDEFAVLLADDDPPRLLAVADRMRAAVSQPARLDGIELTLRTSVGAAVRDQEVMTGGDLLRRADVAMHQAKTGHEDAVLYDPSRDEYSRARLQLAEELRYGIDRGEIAVWYQPQVDAGTGRSHSVEALVRWMHPARGLLSPALFLPAARRAGLMGRLTEAIVEQVAEDAVQWHRQGLELQVSVNVAPPELLDDRTMRRILATVEASGLPRQALVIEVTEDSFLAEPGRARAAIERLRVHGLDVSIDDYGTGYSSLSYLRDLPVQELKIDQAFVAHLLTDPRSAMIVAATTQLAHGLGMRTVAEGVEDMETALALRDFGVDLLQGYLFSKPVPADRIAPWVSRPFELDDVRLPG